MKKQKTLILTLILSLLTSTLVGCGDKPVIDKVQEQGVISSVELEQAEDEDTVTPTYDINSIEESTKFIDYIEKDSYYKQLLDTRNIITYNEIKEAYNSYKTEVLLSKNITPEELFKIMTIMYLDDPIMFQMKTQYDYFLDSNGYVYKVNLYYAVNEISYRSSIETIENQLLKLYSGVSNINAQNPDKVTEYDAYQYIIKNYAAIRLDTEKNDMTITGTLARKYNMHSFSKYFALMCRYVGLESTIVVGKFTDEALNEALTKDSGFNIEKYADVKEKYTTESTENGTKKYTVKYNYDNYAMWNLVKVNDSWYHLDNITGVYVAGLNPQFLTVDGDYSMLHFVNDYTISMSRIFYYNDQILDTIPLCGSNQFQTSYRNNKYLLSHTEEQMLAYLTSTVQVLASRKTKFLSYQFEDEDTFNYFLNNFDKTVKAYNNTTVEQILKYDIEGFRETLTIVVNGFKYK